MRTSIQLLGFTQTVIAFIVVAAFSPAQAQEIATLTAPGNSISVGVGVASGDEKDRARSGMFNGLRTQQGHGLLGFSYMDRDNASGKWFTLEGRNLGLDNRELNFSYRKLGDMKLWGDYSEVVRHDPRTINTGLIGAGTTTPSVVLLPTAGSGSELNLDLKRKGFSLNAEKWLDGAVQMEINFKNEDKSGARLFGKGFNCSNNATGTATSGSGSLAAGFGPACVPPGASVSQWALLMLPEPVNSTIRQIDVKLNWSGARLNLSGGYYGSFYTNANGNITPSVPANLLNPLGASTALNADLLTILGMPMALSPDSQAMQYYVAGNYKLTPKTKLNFKYSYTHATQNEGFAAMGLTGAPTGQNGLGGILNTTKAQVGFSSHPLDKLHVHGDLNYVGKDDKTPIALYNQEGANTFTNGHISPKKFDGKLEAQYKLPLNYSFVGGVKYEREDAGTLTATDSLGGISGIRQKLQEKGYRLELRKTMSETLNGSLSYHRDHRVGDSSWLKPRLLPLTGAFEADPTCVSSASSGGNACIYGRTSIFPFVFEDRQRDKARLMVNFTPADRLALTFLADVGSDTYRGPTEHGLRDTGMRMYSADAAYTLSDKWKVNGYLSRGQQKTSAGHSTGYDADLSDTATSFGLGLAGKPSSRWQVGADLTYLNDLLKYGQTQDPSASAANTAFLAASGGLPDVTYRLTRLKLFSEYALDKISYLRVDLVHQRSFFNEWTYNYNNSPFFYSDNTTLSSQQQQNVTFVGASYVMRFQ